MAVKVNTIEKIGEKEFQLVLNASAKFEKDLETVKAILAKPEINAIDRFQLLTIYKAAFHNSGKIEGVTSFDSTATNCGFCQKMRKAAENNPAHICNYCYDFAQEHSFKGANVLNRHTLNMLIMSSVEFTVDELRMVSVTYINRVNSSGDTPNVIYAKNMLRIALANPAFKFAYWAKNTADVIAACDEIGKPANMTLIQSSPIIGKPAKLAKYFDVVFTVYATREDVDKAIAAGANECNGKKCKDCGYKCYLNGWKAGSNIAEYLRVDNATREKMSAAIG